jgi:hypothetical protein
MNTDKAMQSLFVGNLQRATASRTQMIFLLGVDYLIG